LPGIHETFGVVAGYSIVHSLKKLVKLVYVLNLIFITAEGVPPGGVIALDFDLRGQYCVSDVWDKHFQKLKVV
jgi:hypothetical protein